VADKTLQFVREMAGLIKPYFGIPAVDKNDLDAMIDAEKERIKQEGN